MTRFAIVNLTTSEKVGEAKEGRRFGVEVGLKLSREPVAEGEAPRLVPDMRFVELRAAELGAGGLIWPDKPFVALPLERSEDLAADAVATGLEEVIDLEAGKVLVRPTFRAMTTEELEARERSRTKALLLESDHKAPRMLEELLDVLAAGGMALPNSLAEWRSSRQTLRGRLAK